MENKVYNKLIEQYNNLSDDVKNALLVYKSRLSYFINEIATVSSFMNKSSNDIFNELSDKDTFINKYNDYKNIVDLDINMFAKKTIFYRVNFDNILDFIESLKNIYKTLKKESLIIDEDITSYRIVSVNNNDVSFVSKSDIISTSVNIDSLDDFMINEYNHLYKINVKDGTNVLVFPYAVLIDLIDDRLIVAATDINQKEIVLFKDNSNVIEYDVVEKDMDNGKLYIHSIEVSPKNDLLFEKNLTK